MSTSLYQLNQVEFSDCKVIDVLLDINHLVFNIDMADLYSIEERKFVQNIRFTAISWNQLKVTSYHAQTNTTFNVAHLEEIECITKVSVYQDEVIFCAFGVQSGNWIELKFTDLQYQFLPISS